MLSLDQLPRFERAVVLAISGDRSYRRRLLEMGLVPGTPVSIVNRAPWGDPIEIEVRNARLSLRKSEAAHIEVAPQAVSPSIKNGNNRQSPQE